VPLWKWSSLVLTKNCNVGSFLSGAIFRNGGVNCYDMSLQLSVEFSPCIYYPNSLPGVYKKTSHLVFPMQNSLPSESTVVFIVSTTGQGDPPDTMKVPFHFITLQKHSI
jgi:hypothetical protein